MKNLSSHLVFIGVALIASVTTSPATLVFLNPDGSQSTPAGFGSSVGGVLNDSFAYNPNSPTGPLPEQTFSGPNCYHADGTSTPAIIAFTFDGVYQGLFLDLYGRDSSLERDNNLTIDFYNGSWDLADRTDQIIGFTIADNPPYYGRATATPGIQADRFLISSLDPYFTIMELRANGDVSPVPEPINVALGVFGVAVMMIGVGRRLYARANLRRRFVQLQHG